jgi:hypothetical protein
MEKKFSMKGNTATPAEDRAPRALLARARELAGPIRSVPRKVFLRASYTITCLCKWASFLRADHGIIRL